MWVGTRNPKVTPMRTVVTMEMAARSVSLRWPAKDWVMVVTENMARRLNIDGPAIRHSFFDSAHVRPIRSLCFAGSTTVWSRETDKGSFLWSPNSCWTLILLD